MINTKTLQFLMIFNERELKNLNNFIESNYFVKELNVKKLYKYLIANLNKKPDKIVAYSYIYPKEKFNLSRFNYLSTTLYNSFKKFVEVEQLLEKSSFYDTSVLAILKKQNRQHLYQLEETIIVNKNNKYLKKNSLDYQKNYLFEYERLNFYAELQRTETKYIENLHFNLDAYYFIEKLKASCTSINQQKLYKTDSKQNFTKLLIDYIENSDLLEKIPLLSLYYNSYRLLISNRIKDFQSLKIALENFEFDVNEIRDAFIFGLNYCIQQINSGNTSFNNEIFEMYQTGIKKEILLVEGKLSAINFSNIVTIGLRLKRFKEVEHFIKQNSKLLLGSEKKSYYAFNLAKVYFEKNEFEKVTALYNEKLIKEILLNIQMRILQIKAFFELKEFEICESLVISTDQLLNRKGILAYHKKVFKNFIKFTKSLIILNSFDKKEIADLRNKITESDALMNKEWLLRKLTP